MPKVAQPVSAIPGDVMGELARLRELSSTVNGKTALDDPRRQASEDFCKLAASVLEEYRVSSKVLSVALGMSPTALWSRLGRNGYGPLSPSQKRNTYPGPAAPRSNTAKKAECKRGHPLVEGNLYYDAKGNRKCKACVKIRDHARIRDRRRKAPSVTTIHNSP